MNEGKHGGKPRAEMARRANPERLGAFSDAVIAVIITIMVLELKAPERPAFAALARLWPTALSYAVSYLFVAIIWINHHHLMRFVRKPSNRSHQVEFPASVFGIARALRHPMGSSHTAELGACRDLGLRIRLCGLRLSCL
jgi:hypothetical protein